MRNTIDGTMKMTGRRIVLNRWVFWTTLGMLLAASGLGPAAMAQASPEDPTTSVMMAPYSRSEANGNAVADHQTGLLAIGGAAAQGTGTWGVAWLEMDHVLAQDVEAIEYEIALDRSVAYGWGATAWAWARSSGGQFDRVDSPGAGPIVQGTGPITLSLRLEDPNGVVPAGIVSIRVGLSGSGQSCAISLSIIENECLAEMIWGQWAVWFVAEGTVRSITATVQPAELDPPEGGLELQAVGYKEKGLQKADLTWTNATTDLIDVVRDDVVIATMENDGAYTDAIDARGQGSYGYQVCEAGTATCSNPAVVEF